MYQRGERDEEIRILKRRYTMPIAIVVAFNNRGWKDRCINAYDDKRLFICREDRVNNYFSVDNKGLCKGNCQEKDLCKNFKWNSNNNYKRMKKGDIVYFFFKDSKRNTNKNFMLWGKSKVKKVEGNSVFFEKFSPYPEDEWIRVDIRKILGKKWGSGTFRYLSEKQNDKLNKLIDAFRKSSRGTFEKEINVKNSGIHRQYDAAKRVRIENEAMERAKEYFKEMGYKVVDVSKKDKGWDFEVSKDGEELYVEVKGLSGENVNIELTPNEYEKMQNNKDKYRIFVLTNADKKKGDYYIFSYEINGKLIDEKKKVELTIEERTGARCRESL